MTEHENTLRQMRSKAMGESNSAEVEAITWALGRISQLELAIQDIVYAQYRSTDSSCGPVDAAIARADDVLDQAHTLSEGDTTEKKAEDRLREVSRDSVRKMLEHKKNCDEEIVRITRAFEDKYNEPF